MGIAVKAFFFFFFLSKKPKVQADANADAATNKQTIQRTAGTRHSPTCHDNGRLCVIHRWQRATTTTRLNKGGSAGRSGSSASHAAGPEPRRRQRQSGGGGSKRSFGQMLVHCGRLPGTVLPPGSPPRVHCIPHLHLCTGPGQHRREQHRQHRVHERIRTRLGIHICTQPPCNARTNTHAHKHTPGRTRQNPAARQPTHPLPQTWFRMVRRSTRPSVQKFCWPRDCAGMPRMVGRVATVAPSLPSSNDWWYLPAGSNNVIGRTP